MHEVRDRRFVLINADHPIVTAISENAERLQTGDIQVMPEGLVKIGQSLYESVLPVVQKQVNSQIKVRDLSRMTVSAQPAEFNNWGDARNALMVEMKRPNKQKMHSALAAAPESEHEQIRAKYNQLDLDMEHDIDYTPRELHMEVEMAYDFLSGSASADDS